MKRLVPSMGLGVVFALLIGCGGETPPTLVTVTGKVSLKGQPVAGGGINFHPDAGNSYTKDKPSCLLSVDGTFTMKTFPFGEGVAPGKYKVTLAPELASRLKMPKYSDPAKTPWTIDVPATGVNGKEFEVK